MHVRQIPLKKVYPQNPINRETQILRLLTVQIEIEILALNLCRGESIKSRALSQENQEHARIIYSPEKRKFPHQNPTNHETQIPRSLTVQIEIQIVATICAVEFEFVPRNLTFWSSWISKSWHFQWKLTCAT